jgi:hypothetical protein
MVLMREILEQDTVSFAPKLALAELKLMKKNKIRPINLVMTPSLSRTKIKKIKLFISQFKEEYSGHEGGGYSIGYNYGH